MKYVINCADFSIRNVQSFLDKYSKILTDAGFKIRVLPEDKDHIGVVIITVKSLNDLKKLASVVGEIIVYDSDYTYPEYSRITIYDDYME